MIAAIALAVLLLLCLMVTGIQLLSRQSQGELERLDGFLRAVAVGESCHARVLGRLEAAPWESRWFKGTIDVDSGLWHEGSYDYLIADGPGAYEADLLVRAVEGPSKVVMYWRLRAEPFTLAAFRRVTTTYFSHCDPELPATPAGLDRVRRAANEVLAQRDQNRDWVLARERDLAELTDGRQLAAMLDVPSPGQVLDGLPPPEGDGSPLPSHLGPEAQPQLSPIPQFPPTVIPPLAPVQVAGPGVGGLPGAVGPVAVDPTPEGLRAMQSALAQAVERLDLVLAHASFDDPARPANDKQSTFTAMEERVKKRLQDCRGGAGCPPDEVQRLEQCEGVINSIHSDLRPQVLVTTNESFVLLGKMDELGRRLGGGDPSLVVENRELQTRAKYFIEEAQRLEREFESRIGPSSCAQYR